MDKRPTPIQLNGDTYVPVNPAKDVIVVGGVKYAPILKRADDTDNEQVLLNLDHLRKFHERFNDLNDDLIDIQSELEDVNRKMRESLQDLDRVVDAAEREQLGPIDAKDFEVDQSIFNLDYVRSTFDGWLSRLRNG